MRQRVRKGIQGLMALLFPLVFIFFSPFIVLKTAKHGIISGSAVMFGVLLIVSIVGSRIYCGWICPGGAIQDQVAFSNPRKWNSKAKNASRYIIWTIWLSFLIYIYAQHAPLKLDFFSMAKVTDRVVMGYFIVVILIYLFALLTGKRGMCHSLCWMSPFMIIGEKIADFLHIPRLRLKANSEDCISCGICTKNCPMSLDVQDMIKSGNTDSSECISCMKCVDTCPKNVISCSISKKDVAIKI